jgi:succinate dehydrogenase/fumarate reductase-like Fe-S protein
MDRVLDLLHYVKWNLDGSLTFRRSCAHGVCGSDAMLINGANRLACRVLVRELGEQITVEPLRGLPVKKDLLVDMDPFFESYREVLPVPDQRRACSGHGTAAVTRAAPALRRHHQVHPVRGLHHLVPGLLGRRPVLRAGVDRQRAPLHLRFARPGNRGAWTC